MILYIIDKLIYSMMLLVIPMGNTDLELHSSVTDVVDHIKGGNVPTVIVR